MYATHPLVVLGEVEKLEPPRQRAHQQLDLAKFELRYQPREVVGGGRITAPHRSRQCDRPIAKVDSDIAIAAADHVSENFAEERCVVLELAPTLPELCELEWCRRDGHRACWMRAAHVP